MTDWKELARKHEESANEYARMNYELEAINADLLEALQYLADMPLAGTTKDKYGETICSVRRIARKAIRKATE